MPTARLCSLEGSLQYKYLFSDILVSKQDLGNDATPTTPRLSSLEGTLQHKKEVWRELNGASQ
jgi:hypothetical protein